jgi:hypothetical protein
MNLEAIFNQYKEKSIEGRYITLDSIEQLLLHNSAIESSVIGKSVQGKPIYQLKIGSGPIKILMWSQMHGNESTTTKALIDFINFLTYSEIGIQFQKQFSFCMLPMLNPDGAALYTRENANLVDLNRDAQHLSQPESKVLRNVFNEFQPDFCYNLHDQRTIYGTEGHNLPATVSFLAPSYNQACDINDVRTQAISVIVAMNKVLQNFIPNQVGRFDDSFNINCVGDTFQNLNVPTILIEAGHFPNDFEREMTRKYIFIAVVAGFQFLESKENNLNAVAEYLVIPKNKVFFYDIIYKNVSINYDNKKIIANIAIQNKEELVNDTLLFEAYIESIGDLKGYFGHFEFDAKTELYTDDLDNIPQINQKADFYIGKSIKIVNGLIKM